MSGLKQFSIADIRKLNPCYDPNRYLSEDWSGTALDILSLNEIPSVDRVWVITRLGALSDKDLRLFAVWCARQVQYLMKDERSLRALDVAEMFANGEATKEELAAARAAAWAAAGAAARAAAVAAARAAAGGAAGAAAMAAAGDAAWAAARAAAVAAAGGAAGDAAWDAAWAARVEKLKEMIGGAE